MTAGHNCGQHDQNCLTGRDGRRRIDDANESRAKRQDAAESGSRMCVRLESWWKPRIGRMKRMSSIRKSLRIDRIPCLPWFRPLLNKPGFHHGQGFHHGTDGRNGNPASRG